MSKVESIWLLCIEECAWLLCIEVCAIKTKQEIDRVIVR